MNVLRNILACLIGVVVGGAVNMAIVVYGPLLIPGPEGVDVSNAESIAANIHLYQPRHFAVPFVAHALGTLSGAVVAVLAAVSHRTVIAYFVGAFFLAGGIAAARLIPAPTWFIVLDLGLAYMPMSILAAKIGCRAKALPAGST